MSYTYTHRHPWLRLIWVLGPRIVLRSVVFIDSEVIGAAMLTLANQDSRWKRWAELPLSLGKF